MRWELRTVSIVDGKRHTVEWDGETGEDAARRYVDCHRDQVVIAYRRAAEYGVSVLGRAGRIVEAPLDMGHAEVRRIRGLPDPYGEEEPFA